MPNKYIVGFRASNEGTFYYSNEGTFYYSNPKGEGNAKIMDPSMLQAYRFNDKRAAERVGRLMRPHNTDYFILEVFE